MYVTSATIALHSDDCYHGYPKISFLIFLVIKMVLSEYRVKSINSCFLKIIYVCLDAISPGISTVSEEPINAIIFMTENG